MKPSRQPSMAELCAFATAARCGNLGEASEILCVTQGAISRHILRLEECLGAILFERHARGVSLTKEGRSFYERVGPALTQLALVFSEFRPLGPGMTELRVHAAPTLASRWLIRRAHLFQQKYPQTRLILSSNPPYDQFTDPQVDCWLVPRLSNSGRWPEHLHVTYILGREIVPVCHPSVAHQILQPGDLLRFPLLWFSERPEYWRLWCEAHEVLEPHRLGSSFGVLNGLIDAVIDNFGVGLVNRCLIGEDLRAGRLAIPLELPLQSRGGYYLCVDRNRADDARIEALRSWLLECAAETEQGR